MRSKKQGMVIDQEGPEAGNGWIGRVGQRQWRAVERHILKRSLSHCLGNKLSPCCQSDILQSIVHKPE